MYPVHETEAYIQVLQTSLKSASCLKLIEKLHKVLYFVFVNSCLRISCFVTSLKNQFYFIQ